MTCSAAMSGALRANSDNPAQRSSIARRSRPPNKGVRGFDAHQQIKGRPRHLLVETLGWRLTVVVTAARMQDRDGAMHLLDVLRHRCSRLRVRWADQAYAGDLIAWVWARRRWCNVRLDIVKRPEGAKGFLLRPKRGIVERPFAWLGRYRRFAKDDE